MISQCKSQSKSDDSERGVAGIPLARVLGFVR